MVVFQRLLLSICCMEELIRIVGSGGSMQAEKTLLNVHRSKSVSVPTLVKLFGNKKRVDSVRQFLRSLCVEWIPALQEGLRATLASAHRRRQQLQQQQPPQPLAATGTSWLSASEAAMVEGYQGAMTALFTFLGTCSQVMGAGFLLSHCQEVLEVITSSAVYQVTEWASATSAGMPSGSLQRTATTTTTTMANLEESASLWRYATLTAVLRSFPGCWHMSQPFLTPLLLVAVHRVNVDDSRTNPLCQEVLAVLEAVMEPQLLLRAAAECLWGWEQTTTGLPIKPAIARVNTTTTTTSAASSSSVSFRLSTAVHAVPLLYQSVTRLLERLNREEISHMRFLCDGTLARDNFWLASLDMLARSPVLPPSETTMVVLNAFQTFFVKFKAKHCNVFLSNIAMWAFGEQHGGPADSLGSEHSRALNTPTAPDQHKKKRRMEEGDEGEEDEEDDTTNRVKPNPSSPTGTSLAPLTRLSLHRWTLFYSLYNHLLTKLESIMDFSFGVAMPYVIQHLHRFNDNHHNSAPLEADSDGEGDNDDHHHRRGGQEKSLSSRLALFLEGVLEALRRVCTACTPGPDYDYRVTPDVYVAHTEVFNAVMPAAVRQLSNQTGLSDSMHPFPHRVEHHVLPTLRAMFIALGSSGQGTNSNKLQSKMQAEVLRSLRHPSPAVRRMALKALDGMYEDGGEELAARLMAEMLPSVVEMTEDRDALVVEEARTLCDHLSTITGQDVLHAMSG